MVANVARQASAASTSASNLLAERPNQRGQHQWRCLRATVAAKERECRALKERIAAIEERLGKGEVEVILLADFRLAHSYRET